MIAVLALLALLALAPGAQARVLAEEDANELANALAEATATQGICYGWHVDVSDPTGAEHGADVGSNFGPGSPLDPARPECEGYVRLVADVVYTPESSDAEDRAAWEVDSDLRDPPTIEEIEALGYGTDDLLGDDNDVAIINAVGALPQLAADHGQAKPVPFEPAGRDPGTGGEPTGDPGSDLLREHGALIALCLLMTFGGLAWLWVLRRDAARARRRPPRRTTTAP